MVTRFRIADLPAVVARAIQRKGTLPPNAAVRCANEVAGDAKWLPASIGGWKVLLPRWAGPSRRWFGSSKSGRKPCVSRDAETPAISRPLDGREIAARALCEFEGQAPDAMFEGRPMWMSYLEEVDVVLKAVGWADI